MKPFTLEITIEAEFDPTDWSNTEYTRQEWIDTVIAKLQYGVVPVCDYISRRSTDYRITTVYDVTRQETA